MYKIHQLKKRVCQKTKKLFTPKTIHTLKIQVYIVIYTKKREIPNRDLIVKY